MKKARLSLRVREILWFYALISPWALGFLVFTLGPLLLSVYLSFTDWDMFSSMHFIGIENYEILFEEDEIFLKALNNTFYYSLVSVPLGLGLSLAIAWLLNRPAPLVSFFRMVFYLPSMVPIVATAMVFTWLLAPTTGLINKFLGIFGIVGPAWLLDENWVIPALILMSLWAIGGGIVLLLAGMKGIPQEFYEAATIDGANEWHKFYYITIPALSPIIFFNLVTNIIASLQTFAQVYIMTSGGPNNASMMVVPYLFENAFRFFKMGYASAMAWVLFIIILALTALVFRFSSFWVFYESELKRS